MSRIRASSAKEAGTSTGRPFDAAELATEKVGRAGPVEENLPGHKPAARSGRRRSLGDLALIAGVLVFVVAIWEIVTVSGAVSEFVLPTPGSTVRTLWDGIIGGSIWRWDIWVTFQEMMIGYLIGAAAGVVLGTLLASSRRVERTFFPYLVFLQTVPLVAVAPLLLIWFGFGLKSKIVTVSLVVLFPVLVNTLSGLKSTPQSRVDLLRGYGATPIQIFTKLKLPAAAPNIFTGLDIGIVYSPVGAIVAEFLGAGHGLGVAIFQSEQNLDIAAVFALLVILGVMGIGLHLILLAVRRRAVFWERFTSSGWRSDPDSSL